MKRDGNVIQNDGDADCQIVQTTFNKSETRTITLIGEDTDLLIILLYHQKPNTKSVYLCVLNCFLSTLFSGYDTTSRIHGIGKKALLQKFVKGSM